jgi:hypothetical protein
MDLVSLVGKRNTGNEKFKEPKRAHPSGNFPPYRCST